MKMHAVQVRLSDEQLTILDRKVIEGRYPNRSEAIRDYLRKAQLWEALEKILDLGDVEGFSDEELDMNLSKVRENVYKNKIAPKLKGSSIKRQFK